MKHVMKVGKSSFSPQDAKPQCILGSLCTIFGKPNLSYYIGGNLIIFSAFFYELSCAMCLFRDANAGCRVMEKHMQLGCQISREKMELPFDLPCGRVPAWFVAKMAQFLFEK